MSIAGFASLAAQKIAALETKSVTQTASVAHLAMKMLSAKWKLNLGMTTTATSRVSHHPAFSKATTTVTLANEKAAKNRRTAALLDAFATRNKHHIQLA